MSERYGEYELLAQFAKGGMAEVFLGRRIGVEGFAREVVVKRMLPKLAVDEACVRMFLDEARLTALLQHPNVAQVLDLGRMDDTYFIAMELVDGPDLKSLFRHSITNDIPLPAELCAYIVARVADGLAYAHSKTDPATDEPLRIVHRDVNHANILISRHGGVKIVDFGVAHAENRSVVTDVGGLKGKMGYIAPEQCLGDPFDHRADIFALGVVLHELLVRTALFYRKSDLQTLENIVYSPADPPSKRVAGLDDEIDAIVLGALQKSPDDRTETAGDLARQLDQWLRARVNTNLSADLSEWVVTNARTLCPTDKIPRSTRTSNSSIKRFTTGDYRELGIDAFNSGTSTRRRLQNAVGPITSRRNPQLRKGVGGAKRSNLPAARGTFIGHANDLAKIAAQFAANARMLTLFGTAGVGKSRVALEHAQRHRKAFPESTVWWCKCAESEGVDGAIAALSSAMGVPLVGEATRQAAVEQLGHALNGRGRALVVLDDFDKLVDHVEETIAAWLAMAPQVRFLVTSRSLLRSPDEAAIEIHPLALPGPSADGESEAEEFFLARARSVRPEFEPSKQERIAIAKVVQRLDGLPLAIELAAARISVLTPDALLGRLSQRFDVLRGSGRGPVDKRSTLRTAIDWSWDTLNTDERDALVQATVFRGGFTLTSAEEVLSLSGDAMVLDVIQALRDRSMLRVSGTGGELRFSLFESIREYASSKASSLQQLEGADRRHELHFLAASEHWSSRVHTHDGVRARKELARELDNYIAAHERALARRPLSPRDVEVGLRIALASFPLLIERGPVALLWRLLGESLEAAGTLQVSRRWLGMALTAYGEVLARTGQPADGLKMAEEALRIGRRGGIDVLQAHALVVVALCRWLTDEHDGAMAAGLEARRIGQRHQDLFVETRCLNLIGCVHFARGERSTSAQTLRACITAARQVGHLQIEAMAHSNVGCIHADSGALDEAEGCFRSALEACEKQRNRRGVGVNRCELAIVAQERGDFATAGRHFRKAMVALTDVGDRQRLAYARFYRGCFELERGEHRHAASLLRTAGAFFEAAGNERLWAQSMALLGYLHATAGSSGEADELIAKAEKVAAEQLDPPLTVLVEAMRGAASAVRAIRDKTSLTTDSLEAARAAVAKARAPWLPDERHPNGRAPPIEWSKETRFALRIVERLLPAT